MRFFFYSHDGMGLGHVRRQLAIASALTSTSSKAQVLLATSIDEVSQLGLPSNVDTLKLPSLRKMGNQRYVSRRLALAPEEMRDLRGALFAAAIGAFQPDVILVDKHPLGAGGELRQALESVKGSGVRVVLGLRDILDETGTVLKEWSDEQVLNVISDLFDSVLIYGVRSVFDPVEQYQFTPTMAARTRFCGYVLNTAEISGRAYLAKCAVSCSRKSLVLATAGGGEDGFQLLQTFILACRTAPWKGIVVAGPFVPEEEFHVLQHLALQNRVRLLRFIPNLSNLFWSIDCLVCMGGYNTLAEAISTGVPTVCVPRVCPRSEQLIRARAFEELGLLQTVHPDYLSADTLRFGIACALRLPRQVILDRANLALSFEGTRIAAETLLGLAAGAASDSAAEPHAYSWSTTD